MIFRKSVYFSDADFLAIVVFQITLFHYIYVQENPECHVLS